MKADPYTFRCRGAGRVISYMIHRTESVNDFIFDRAGNLWGTFLMDFGCGSKALQSNYNFPPSITRNLRRRVRRRDGQRPIQQLANRPSMIGKPNGFRWRAAN
jgi:hypothetical protein